MMGGGLGRRRGIDRCNDSDPGHSRKKIQQKQTKETEMQTEDDDSQTREKYSTK